MTPRKFLALAAVATLALGAAACSSDDSESASTSQAPTTRSADGGSGSTTPGAEEICTRGEIISAALAEVDPAFDLMDSYGCEDDYAWAWLVNDSTTPNTIQSVILEEQDGIWVPENLANICGAASAGYPPEVLEKGCAYQTPAPKQA